MKLKKHEYLITVEYDYDEGPWHFKSVGQTFAIRAIPVTLGQAKKIVKVLFPRPKYKKVRIVDCEAS